MPMFNTYPAHIMLSTMLTLSPMEENKRKHSLLLTSGTVAFFKLVEGKELDSVLKELRVSLFEQIEVAYIKHFNLW